MVTDPGVGAEGQEGWALAELWGEHRTRIAGAAEGQSCVRETCPASVCNVPALVSFINLLLSGALQWHLIVKPSWELSKPRTVNFLSLVSQ